MSFDAVDGFVQCLIKTLCRKFSLKDGTSLADKLSEELLEFSNHFQCYVLSDIYKISAPLITSKALFIVFLSSVCSDICGLEDDAERKFFILCAFITNLVTLSFSVPCYRLVQDMKEMLKFQLKVKLGLSFDSDLKVAFENLEGKCLEMAANRQWIRNRLHQLRNFIDKAAKIKITGLENAPDLASRIKTVNDMETDKSTDDAACEDGPCPFCETNCKNVLETLLNG